VDRDEGIKLGASLEQHIADKVPGHEFKFDESVYRGEQPVYLPLHDSETFAFEGVPIDPGEWIHSQPQASSNGSGISSGSKADWLEQLITGESVHDSARAISMNMAWDGVKKETVKAVLRALLRDAANHRDANRIARLLDGGELDDLVNGAFQKVAEGEQLSFDEVMEMARALPPDGDGVEAVVKAAARLKPIQLDRVLKAIKKATGINMKALREQVKVESNGDKAPDHLALARELVGKIGTKNILAAESFVWRWDDRGVWRPLEDRAVKQEVQRFIDRRVAAVTRGSVDSVADVFKTEVFRPQQEFNIGPPECVNVLNGELTLDDKGEWILQPHEREHYRTTQVPVEWDPEAKAPRFIQFLTEVFQGDPDADDKVWAVLEMMGYTLMAHCRYERFIMLVGTGANGKSVLLFVLEMLCGRDNVAGVQPSEFSNRFQRAHLHRKLANIVSELRQGAVIDDEALKGITSGELTTVEHKNRDPFDMRPFSTCWFGTNHLPHTRDFSDALFRRALVVEFNRVFKPELGNCDAALKDKLVGELPGVLLMVLNAYKRALVQGFTMPASCVEVTKKWRLEADQVAQFVDDMCLDDPNGKENFMVLYGTYKRWAVDHGIKNAVGSKTFGDRLEQRGYKRQRGGSGNCHAGLRLIRKVEFCGA
jgi:putative DNA primase/helicase